MKNTVIFVEQQHQLSNAHAQRDELLAALKDMATAMDAMGDMPDGLIHPLPWRELRCEDLLAQASAAIAKVEGGAA